MTKTTDDNEEVTPKTKSVKHKVNIVEQITETEKIVVRFENIIIGKCEYYSNNKKYPTNIAMNSKVFKHLLLNKLITNDKCLESAVTIDNSLKNDEVVFS